MDELDYQTIVFIKNKLCQTLLAATFNNIYDDQADYYQAIKRRDYNIIAFITKMDYRSIKAFFGLSENGSLGKAKTKDVLAAYLLNMSLDDMPFMQLKLQIAETQRSEHQNSNDDREGTLQNNLSLYAGSYQVYWAAINKIGEIERSSDGNLTLNADGKANIRIIHEQYEGQATLKGEVLYFTFGNDSENFYYIVRVGRTRSPQMLRYLPAMVLAVHNAGHQYANIALLVKEHTNPINVDKINAFFAELIIPSIHITNEMIAIIEQQNFN